MSDAYRLSLLGLRDPERETIRACLRLLAARVPRYELVRRLDECDFVIADADHAPSVQLVVATERLGCTLFVGAVAPVGAQGFMARPLDARVLLRELDALVAQPARARPCKARPLAWPTIEARVRGQGLSPRPRRQSPRPPRPRHCWWTTARLRCVSWKHTCSTGGW